MARRIIVPLLLLAACTDDQAVVGPFTGETRRFAIDELEMPTTRAQVTPLAKDLDGDGFGDNQLGNAITGVASYGSDAQQHGRDLVASGAIASTIEIQADDFQNDPSVGVTFYGRDGAPARVVGGRLVDGHFLPNEIRRDDGRTTGQALLLLPVFADADPIELDAVTLEIELDPNGDGYDMRLFGAVRPEQALEQAYDAIRAQLLARPEDHRSMWTIADHNLDGVLAFEELDTSFIKTLLSSDVELYIDGTLEKVLAFAFRMHATPCASGHCLGTSSGTCFDRVRNGDETDVDCGGGCAFACTGGAACSVAADCQSRSCDAGSCAAVSCSDGVKNGLEASLDCGGACATKCASGAVCGYAFDCASHSCSATTSTGTCQ